MVHGFPGANLIGQLLRQITQPLSKAIVKRAKKRPFFRKYVLIQLGRFYYWCEDRMKRRGIPIAAMRKPSVDDVRTMELGTKLLIELVVFALLWVVIVYESGRAVERARLVEQRKIQVLNDLEMEKDQLMRRVQDQIIMTKWLKDVIAEYSGQVGATLPDDPRTKKDEEQEQDHPSTRKDAL